MNQQWPQFLRLDYLVLYCVVFFTHVQKKIFFHEVCCHKYDIYEKSHFVLLPMKITSSQLAAIAFRFFDVIVSFLITALLIIITFCSFQCYHPGGVLGISSDGDDRMEPKVKTQKNP